VATFWFIVAKAAIAFPSMTEKAEATLQSNVARVKKLLAAEKPKVNRNGKGKAVPAAIRKNMVVIAKA
jgi:hypothetical protein